MPINQFLSRLHLYLALGLLPWFIIYGLSAIPFSHPELFQKLYGKPEWVSRPERKYDIEIPADADLRQIGARIMKENDLKGSFGANRPNPKQYNLYVFTFWKTTQVNYYPQEKRLVIQDRKFRWDHFLTGMHARGGFAQSNFLSDAWGVMVDIVCLGMLIWIITGIYLWWRQSTTRIWGAVALLGGFGSFLLFLRVL
jgi:hypothetical protein